MIYILKLKKVLCEWKISFEIGSLVYEVIEKAKFDHFNWSKNSTFSLSAMVSKKQDSYAPGATDSKLMISWPNKKSFKWGQYLSVTCQTVGICCLYNAT